MEIIRVAKCFLKSLGWEVTDEKRYSPLRQAVEQNDVDEVRTILHQLRSNREAETEQESRKYSCDCGRQRSDVNVIQQPLHSGDLDLADDGGVTPFYVACENGNLELATILLAAGCDMTISRNNTGWKNKMYSPLHVAVQNGHIDIVRLLCSEGFDVNVVESLGKTALILACDSMKLDLIELLVQYGADVNWKDSFGHTPLVYALQISERYLKQRYFQHKHNEKSSEIRDTSPGRRKCYIRAINILLQAGALLNPPGNAPGELTPVHYAILYGHLDTTCLLLQHGAVVKAEDLATKHIKWEDSSMLKVLQFYSRDFDGLAARIILERPELAHECGIKDTRNCQQPSALLHLCRAVIRQRLCTRTRGTIEPFLEPFLPIPKTLQQYLMFSDLHHLAFYTMDS